MPYEGLLGHQHVLYTTRYLGPDVLASRGTTHNAQRGALLRFALATKGARV